MDAGWEQGAALRYAGVMENGVFNPATVGTPQGGGIPPLLANITLNSLDWTLPRVIPPPTQTNTV